MIVIIKIISAILNLKFVFHVSISLNRILSSECAESYRINLLIELNVIGA